VTLPLPQVWLRLRLLLRLLLLPLRSEFNHAK